MTDLGDRMLDWGMAALHDPTAKEKYELGMRPTGQEIFDSLSKEEQDAVIGPAEAEMIRQGEATLSDFVERSGGFIRQKPLKDVQS